MDDNQQISTDEAIREKKREYFRNWRKNNPDKVKAAQERYWRRKLEADPAKPYQTR